nr:hypothetical protein [Aquitalea denitrificans]
MLIHHALRLLAVAPGDCLRVEDSASDITAGIAVADIQRNDDIAAQFAGQIAIFPDQPQLAAALGLSTGTSNTRKQTFPRWPKQ